VAGGIYNRAGRRSGGVRPFKITLPSLRPWLRDEIVLFQQREKIRAEFGEDGVKRFDEELKKRARKDRQSSER
jgi:hypothetical protein